jgi:hypothetical protein
MNSSARALALVLSLAVGLAALSNSAGAHHSYAMFDNAGWLTIEGTARALEWTNPHVWVWVDVDDGKGGVDTYGFEAQAPSELQRFFGWTKVSVKSGDRVKVHFAPLRSGRHGGALRTIEFADGRQLLTPRSTPSTPVYSPEAAQPRSAQ